MAAGAEVRRLSLVELHCVQFKLGSAATLKSDAMPHAPSVLSVGRALPPHYGDQDALSALLRKLWLKQHHNPMRVDDLHRAVKVAGRYLALPLDQYEQHDTFEKCNSAFIRVATELGE